MLIAAITTSTDQSGFALYDDHKKIAVTVWDRAVKNSDFLVAEFHLACKKKSLQLSDIKILLLDLGPGSFTGCRISANFAKTIAQSFNLPIYTINSLDIILEQNPKKKWALLDAHKSLYYTKSKDSKITLMTQDQLESILSSAAANDFPSPETMIRLFLNNSSCFEKKNWSEVEPLYIRNPDAVEKIKNQK